MVMTDDPNQPVAVSQRQAAEGRKIDVYLSGAHLAELASGGSVQLSEGDDDGVFEFGHGVVDPAERAETDDRESDAVVTVTVHPRPR